MRLLRSSLSILVCIYGLTAVAFATDSCTQTKFGECFRIHARYEVYTGDGMEVLWPVGTHRLLWAASGTDRLDKLLANHMDESVIFGDFLVCPLTKDIPGEMRHVCIQQMRNLRRVKRKASK
jgi:hypothetical protein